MFCLAPAAFVVSQFHIRKKNPIFRESLRQSGCSPHGVRGVYLFGPLVKSIAGSLQGRVAEDEQHWLDVCGEYFVCGPALECWNGWEMVSL